MACVASPSTATRPFHHRLRRTVWNRAQRGSSQSACAATRARKPLSPGKDADQTSGSMGVALPASSSTGEPSRSVVFGVVDRAIENAAIVRPGFDRHRARDRVLRDFSGRAEDGDPDRAVPLPDLVFEQVERRAKRRPCSVGEGDRIASGLTFVAQRDGSVRREAGNGRAQPDLGTGLGRAASRRTMWRRSMRYGLRSVLRVNTTLPAPPKSTAYASAPASSKTLPWGSRLRPVSSAWSSTRWAHATRPASVPPRIAIR